MENRFKEFKLGEITEITAGGDKPKNFSENKTDVNKVPIYANAVKDNGLYGFTDCPKILKSAVTVSARGSNVGFVAIRKEPFFPIVRVLTLIPSNDKLDVDFLFYNLKQNRHSGTGSGQPQITVPNISNRSITIPSILVQKQIAKVLSDLDAKIEVNNKINQELELMAKTLYDYWFVQFDFPMSKEYAASKGKPELAGKPYKTSGGKMVFNKELKRDIPEGWEDGTLSDIANITMGQSPSGSSYNEEAIGTVFYQGSTDFGQRFPTVRKYTTEPSRMAEEGDILLSVRAPVGTLNQAMENCCIGRGLAALNEKEGSISFLWSQMEYFKQIFDRRNASGTTFGSITKDDLFSLKLCIPEKQILERFKLIADPFHEKIVITSKENQKLSELRDWLLPMLMNGQVRVAHSLEEGHPKDVYEDVEDELGVAAEGETKYGKV